VHRKRFAPIVLLVLGIIGALLVGGSAQYYVTHRSSQLQSGGAQTPQGISTPKTPQDLAVAYRRAHDARDRNAVLALFYLHGVNEQARLLITLNVSSSLRYDVDSVEIIEPDTTGIYEYSSPAGLVYRTSLPVTHHLKVNYKKNADGVTTNTYFVGTLDGGFYLVTDAPQGATRSNPFHFQSRISRGSIRVFPVGARELIFRLTPDEYGWTVEMYPAGYRDLNGDGLASIATPPYHGVNPLQIEGWHFRNARNTAPNDGSVSAPQTQREFWFVLTKADAQTVAYAYDQYNRGKTPDFSPNVPMGKGELVILNLKLGNLVPGSRAWIESMDFSVTLEFPISTK